MSQPRNLSTTLPSPSELDNFCKCPCLWYLKDRLWIKSIGDRIPLLAGRLLDKTMEKWLLKEVTNPVELLHVFDTMVREKAPEGVADEDYVNFMLSVRNALEAWLTLYGNVSEEIISVQAKFSIDATIKVDYLVRVPPGLVRIRERKVISPFADLDHEIAKYQLGFQPISYAAQVEKAVGMPIEAVEMEFFIRSAPQRGRYKPIPAAIRRECLYIDEWKKRMWLATAEIKNYEMQVTESVIENHSYDEVPFEIIPRHTINCITKLGQKTYECDFYKACKTNTNPLLMADYFYQSGEKK